MPIRCWSRAIPIRAALRRSPHSGRAGRCRRRLRASSSPAPKALRRERLGDFYLYPIAGRTTIANNQTKQVSFLDVQGVPARKVYGRTVGWLASDGAPVPAASEIAFSSSKEGGLGDALPAGTVRFYQRDAQGNPQFIGENGIGHTPMGSELTLRTGDAFDVYIQAEVEKRETITGAEWERSARWRVIEDGKVVRQGEIERPKVFYRTTMRYTFTNAKHAGQGRTGPVRARPRLVEQRFPRAERGRSRRAAERRPPQVRHQVPANGKREVRVIYETRY